MKISFVCVRGHRLNSVVLLSSFKIEDMKQTKIITLIFITAFLFSCSSTKITSSWKAENYVTKQYRNIMVWAILPETDSSLRSQIETHLVTDLMSKGYRAFSSLQVYRAKAYKKFSNEEIVNEFKSTGVDALITLVLLNKEKEEKYYPGGYFNQPVNSYGNLNKYYSNVFERVLTPGYYVTATNYYWQSSLFETNTNKLVYSAQTVSFDPHTTNLLAHENGSLIIKDMIRKKIIIPPLQEDEQ